MSFIFACIAMTSAALLFFSSVPFPTNPRTAWLNGTAMFWVRSILLLATLITALLAVVIRFLK